MIIQSRLLFLTLEKGTDLFSLADAAKVQRPKIEPSPLSI